MSDRYPLQPLLDATGWSMTQVREIAPCNGVEYQLRLTEGVTEPTADRLAIAAHLLPWEVWPEMADLAYRECGSTDCTTRFIPRDQRGQQRYCSPRCRQREKVRRYRATPHGAETARRVRRTYYWSDPKVREREAALKARPSARRAAAARRRQLRAERREAA